MPLFVIEVRPPADAGEAQEDIEWSELPDSLCGKETEALEIVRELQKFPEWADKEYRIVPRKQSINYLARQKARNNASH